MKYKRYFYEHIEDFVRTGVGLEGKIPSKLSTRAVISGSNRYSLDPRTARIAKNLLLAWKAVYDYPVFKMANAGFFYQIYCSLHSQISKGVAEFPEEDFYRGRFRDENIKIKVGDYVPPQYNSYTDSLTSFLSLLAKYPNTVEGVLLIYLHLMRNQYFANSNKRTAYVFCNYLFRYFDLGCFLVLPVTEEGKKEFLRRLRFFYLHPKQDKRMVTYLKKYYVKVV